MIRTHRTALTGRRLRPQCGTKIRRPHCGFFTGVIEFMAHNVRSLSARLAEMHSELAVAKSDRRSSKTTKLEIEAAKRGTIVVSDHRESGISNG